MKRFFPQIFCFILLFHWLRAQTILWQRCLGGSLFDEFRGIESTETGTYLLVGTTRSYDIEGLEKESADADVWIVKIDAHGKVLWQRSHGTTSNEQAYDIALTPEGDYLIVGSTEALSLSHGKEDVYVIRMDPLGEILWERAYGGRGNDYARSVVPLSDGGCLVVGATGSIDGDIMKNYGGLDFWVIRLDREGNLIWERNYGGMYNDVAHVIVEGDEPGTFLVVGSTDSPDHDITIFRGKTDILVIKIDTLGRKIWSETYGGSSFEEPYSVVRAKDGTFWISGTTFSKDDQIIKAKGKGDLWLFRINGKGELLESHNFGGSWDEGGNRVRLTPDGKNILLAGTTRSSDGDVGRKNKGLYDGWLVRLDSTGNLIWEYSIGGYQSEMFYDMILMSSGDYLGVGYTASTDGDLLYCGGHGGNDGWIVAIRDPDTPSDLITKTPTAIVGYVYDAETKDLILDAEIQLVNLKTNEVVTSVRPHKRFHYYTLFVPDTEEVILGVYKKGYLFVSELVKIPPNQKYTEIRRDFYLKPIKKGEKLSLYNIYFDPGKWDIKPESYPELDRLAQFLKDNPGVYIEISGHTDNTGDPSTKKELSLRRANAVKYYLVRKGIPESRMTTKGYGPDRPVASNETEEGRRLNRRVEFEIINIVN